jgi:hypothetical protein
MPTNDPQIEDHRLVEEKDDRVDVDVDVDDHDRRNEAEMQLRKENQQKGARGSTDHLREEAGEENEECVQSGPQEKESHVIVVQVQDCDEKEHQNRRQALTAKQCAAQSPAENSLEATCSTQPQKTIEKSDQVQEETFKYARTDTEWQRLTRKPETDGKIERGNTQNDVKEEESPSREDSYHGNESCDLKSDIEVQPVDEDRSARRGGGKTSNRQQERGTKLEIAKSETMINSEGGAKAVAAGGLLDHRSIPNNPKPPRRQNTTVEAFTRSPTATRAVQPISTPSKGTRSFEMAKTKHKGGENYIVAKKLKRSVQTGSARGIKSFVLGRQLLWSIFLFYAVLVILSILESTNSTPIQTEMDKRLAKFSKPSSHKRPAYDPHNTTLALLYPLGMIGGYRNQVIRFISFVRYARHNNISQMLLPSIIWSTTHVEAHDRKRFFPVPMEMLFDVDRWNSFNKELPILVDNIEESDCWGRHDPKEYRLPDRTDTKYISPLSQKVLDEYALLTPVVSYSRTLLTGELQIRPRQFNLYPMIQNCTHPVVYGGGKGGGHLWNDYVSMPKIGIRNRVTPEATENSRVISLINQALTPNRQWRDVAHQCVLQHQPLKSSAAKAGQIKVSNYVALHARIETDMMAHKCGRFMQKNLTKVFKMVDSLVDRYNVDKTANDKMQGVFIAVSRQGMKNPVNNTEIQEMADYNWEILLERSITENPNRKSDDRAEIFECGELWTDRWYATQEDIEHDYYGSILPSIINFYIATHASIFVGVQGSSWSTDVWNTRYYQGKGAGNYEYTRGAILPLPDGGLPQPHQNCKEIKFKH